MRSARLPGQAAHSLALPDGAGEVLDLLSPRSAGQILGVDSACACQAARSSVHEIGPHSSELATRVSEPPKRVRKNGAARKLSKNF